MAPAKSRKRKSGQDRVVDEPAKDSGAEKRLPVRAKDDEPPVPVKGTLKVFGDEDEAEAPETASSAAPKKAEEKEVEDSDDDEAPEAVSTHQAALKIKKSAQATQKAAKEQAEEQKRKRQHRDDLFKQQAEERKKAEETAKEAEAAAAAESQSQDGGDDTIARQSEITTGRRRMDRLQIPTVLPDEFLTDSSGESEDDDDFTGANAGPKRRKVSGVEKRLSRQDRGPRDERLGSTVYRVATKTDERLAPKLKKYAKSSKDGLLKRNRSAVKSASGFTTSR